jgi:hypothetical protein
MNVTVYTIASVISPSVRTLLGALMLSVASTALALEDAWADFFVTPLSGDLFLTPMGGDGAGVTTFGLGISPGNFVAYFAGLPSSPNPSGPLLVGFFPAGTSINFGENTLFGGNSYWAFSNGTDQASIVAFTDVDNSLGMGGSVVQQTSANTWLLHLDDAASYLIDDDDNDVLIGLRIGPGVVASEPYSWLIMLTGLVGLGCASYRRSCGEWATGDGDAVDHPPWLLPSGSTRTPVKK